MVSAQLYLQLRNVCIPTCGGGSRSFDRRSVDAPQPMSREVRASFTDETVRVYQARSWLPSPLARECLSWSITSHSRTCSAFRRRQRKRETNPSFETFLVLFPRTSLKFETLKMIKKIENTKRPHEKMKTNGRKVRNASILRDISAGLERGKLMKSASVTRPDRSRSSRVSTSSSYPPTMAV